MESMPVPDQKWIKMIAVVGAFVVTITAGLCILMKQRIKGKEGAAGNTNTVSVSSSTMEREQSEGSDRDSHTSITSEYDVFLSFRGPDARYGIVDHLYECMTGAGLRVFKDDEEIRHGEVIGGELERAIRCSRVYTVVFSRNYASSAWCLRELDMMVDLHGGSNVGRKIILPIFYGADPADVKLRTELYREPLEAHKDRHGEEVVKKWEDALKTVGGISGWDSKAIQGEGRFVRLIVQDIVVKLRIKDRSLPDHLTGIDDQVSNMLNLLDCDSSGVRLVVLHGMGGIGKTTLASVVFNKLLSQFEGSSFISNVRESATGHGGIVNLQNKLSRDILGGQYVSSCNFNDGFGEMIQRIQGKRMLLVLDDVDQFSQLLNLVGKNPEDTLGKGSRVIITTRDKSVCNPLVRLGSELLHCYEMEKLTDNHALQLFSRHAFGTVVTPKDYLCLSIEVVKTTGNLPLALEVIGGHLCCQSKESWKYELKKLKNVLQKRVFDILKVSYDGLDWREKEIFLDIACFREDTMPRRYADYLWEARDLYPKIGEKVLINKSLIKIDSFGKFWIHDQLRDMGREIIRSEGNGRPEKRTRLWDPEDALKIVLQKQVSKKIIAMKLGRHHEAHKFSDENFSGLSNLLLLHLNGTKLIGDFRNIRESLLWLYWRGCNKKLNSNFSKMRSLVILKINGIEGGLRGAKLMMPNLRVLEFENSFMTTSPDLSCCLKLEIMVFCKCFLEEIHHSVGKLESLTYLKIYYCPSLRSLPEELCYARALRELIVNYCEIEEVPELIGRLKSLRTLDLSYNKIRRLPTSICDLKNLLVLDATSSPTSPPLHCCDRLQELPRLPTSLTVLNASCCPLEKGIPEEIGNLSALERLDLSYTNIHFLPATVSQLMSLKSLKLYFCRMLQEIRGLPTSLKVLDASNCPLDKGIPEEIGSLSALKELDLSSSNIRFLPATFSQLTSLWYLILCGCNMLQEVRELPTSLKMLDASYCPLDEGIPEEIGRLLALKKLDLSRSKIRFLPATVSQLTSLKSLRLVGCEMLQELPRLPTSLIDLRFSTKSLRAFPNLDVLTNLTVLRVYDVVLPTKKDYEGERLEISGLGSLDKLKRLLFYPSRMITFTRASELGSLSKLETLYLLSSYMESVLELPLSLCRLAIWDTRKPIPWEHYSNLTLLQVLEISTSKLTEMELSGLDSLPNLTKLSIGSSDSLLRVSNIGRLRGLRSLKFAGCRVLVEIPGLEQLEMLNELTFFDCDSICRIQDLLGLKRLKGVTIMDCSSLLHVPRLMDECWIWISSCVKLRKFQGSYSKYEGERSDDYGEFEGSYSKYEGERSDDYGEFVGRYSEYEGERSDDSGEFEGRYSDYEEESGEDYGEVESSYSESEGESSKTQLEDDSGEGGGGQRRIV